MGNYFKELNNLLEGIEATDNKARYLSFKNGRSKTIRLIKIQQRKGNKIIFIGNG
jgi:hypothetical protein